MEEAVAAAAVVAVEGVAVEDIEQNFFEELKKIENVKSF